MQAVAGKSAAGDAVRHILLDELTDRRTRDRVFAPLVPLARQAAATVGPLSPATLGRLWRRLQAERLDAFETAGLELGEGADPARARAAADALVSEAAGLVAQDGSADAAPLRQLLAICPIARAVLPRMRNYLRTSADEHASAIRLAYRDASAIDEGAPPLLIEVLSAHLEHPWQVLRLVCAVMDRPSEAFFAGSELGRFGEQVLDQVDQRLHEVRSFDADGGAAAGQAAASAACAAVMALTEFDRSLDLGKAGPWIKRIAAQRRNLARGVEMRLRQADPALGRALPVVNGGPLGLARGVPSLDRPVEPRAVRQAQALVAFAAGVRNAADQGGFLVARRHAAEAMDRRLSVQADDLVRAVHEDPASEAAQEARTRLSFVGEALGLLRDGRATEVVRRRTAAA